MHMTIPTTGKCLVVGIVLGRILHTLLTMAWRDVIWYKLLIGENACACEGAEHFMSNKYKEM